MDASTLSQISLPVKDENPIHIQTNGNVATVLSTEVAEHFGKQHKNILRDIADLMAILPESFIRLNFELIDVDVKVGFGTRKDRAFLLTRDAFSLLVMGFTGQAAIAWKLRYIEAFNALEKAALEHTADLARESGYAQGRQETLCLPVMEAERKKGYLAGLKDGKKLEKAQNGMTALAKIVKYARAGLTYPEIGKIFGISHYAVYRRIRSAKKLGICLQKPEFVQRNLPGVG